MAKKHVKTPQVKISGVSINLQGDGLRDADTLDKVKATAIFSHLPENAQEQAYGKLFSEIQSAPAGYPVTVVSE